MPPQNSRPNILLILADDMGFSDLGCYGSEIRTPNLDRLGHDGLRFTQMYNMARCCPSRASLLTGLYPHQAGVGHMVADYGDPAYQGYLNDSCVTIAEVLGAAGYRTGLSGKWHVGGDYRLQVPDSWAPGDDRHPIPTQRGFDSFWGTLTGAGSFFNPPTLMAGESPVEVEDEDFYYTDEISSHAITMIEEAVAEDRPFFQYVAYTAPHWPLHALEEDIARYEGKYSIGWDRLRENRHEQLIAMGILDPRWEIAPRDRDALGWSEARHKDWEDLRMAAYAAQIDRMDQGIGRILRTLDQLGVTDNTLIMFLSDNGGCAELLAEDSNTPDRLQFDTPMANGGRMRMGNIRGVRPGPADTFMSYDLPWANASNTPFRLFKRWTHEGGISTPLIVSWPDRITTPEIVHTPAHVVDIAATCYDVAGAAYPKGFNGSSITPIEGESITPVFDGREWNRMKPIFWEHEGSRAVRIGQWKMVSEGNGPWELYDLDTDRTELHDRAGSEPGRIGRMTRLYDEWAARVGAKPWPVVPETPALPDEGTRHVHTVH